jgi:hypothetical protein
MSNANKPFDFSQFVPGFDFLKNLAGGAAAGGGAGSVPGIPSLASWVAPTLSVEEVDKRIQELKTVQYWLEQNGHALKATIQALEVQKMTLSTLRGMNVRMEDIASAFTKQAAAMAPARPHPRRLRSPSPGSQKKSRTRRPRKKKQKHPRPRSRAPRGRPASRTPAWSIRCSGGARSPSSSSRSPARRCRTPRSSRCRPWPSRWPMPWARRWASRRPQRSQPQGLPPNPPPGPLPARPQPHRPPKRRPPPPPASEPPRGADVIHAYFLKRTGRHAS